MLDTNVLGDFLRGMDPALNARMFAALEQQQAVISAISRAEVRYGQRRLAADDKRRRRIDLLLDQLPTLDWTAQVADRYGQLKAMLQKRGTPIGELDTQIAAHALAVPLPLVTHNTRHFSGIDGLKIEDWRS